MLRATPPPFLVTRHSPAEPSHRRHRRWRPAPRPPAPLSPTVPVRQTRCRPLPHDRWESRRRCRRRRDDVRREEQSFRAHRGTRGTSASTDETTPSMYPAATATATAAAAARNGKGVLCGGCRATGAACYGNGVLWCRRFGVLFDRLLPQRHAGRWNIAPCVFFSCGALTSKRYCRKGKRLDSTITKGKILVCMHERVGWDGWARRPWFAASISAMRWVRIGNSCMCGRRRKSGRGGREAPRSIRVGATSYNTCNIPVA